MAWARTNDPVERASVAKRHDALREEARIAHADLRARIADGSLRGDALRRRFEAVPALARDHVVEEVLGVAYPPLDEASLGPELISYTPSGWDEIVHAFDATKLAARDRFLDIGSGTGKVTLLAALLCGAEAHGLECVPALVDIAREAAAGLGVDRVAFACGDARAAPFDDPDVVFMYLPFTGSVLATVVGRLAATRARFLCAGVLDVDRHPHLVAVGEARSWLQVYAHRSAQALS